MVRLEGHTQSLRPGQMPFIVAWLAGTIDDLHSADQYPYREITGLGIERGEIFRTTGRYAGVDVDSAALSGGLAAIFDALDSPHDLLGIRLPNA
jgi:hypothetical protein